MNYFKLFGNTVAYYALTYYQIESKKITEIVNKQINALVEADIANHTNIRLYVPKDYPGNMLDINSCRDTLVAHKIITQKIIIHELVYITDGCIYYLPSE